MNSGRMINTTCILLALLVCVPLSSLAQQGSPFRSGEIVVAGAPGDLPPGLNAIKHLKNADLTIVAAPRGGEIALAKQLRKKGRRAGVNRIAYANATVNDPTFSLQWHF